MTWFMHVNLATAPTITPSIIERPASKEIHLSLNVSLHNQPQSLLFHHICYKYILHKRHIRYIAYIETFSGFPPHKHPHLRTNSL